MDAARVRVHFGDQLIRLTVAGLETDAQNERPAPVLVHFVAVPNAVVSVHEKAVFGLGDPLEAMAGDPRFGKLNAGMFLGLPVDGRRLSFAENVFYEYREGKIATVWSIIDKAQIEAQLGPAMQRVRDVLS